MRNVRSLRALVIAALLLAAGCAMSEKSRYARHLGDRVAPTWTAPAVALAARNEQRGTWDTEASLGALSAGPSMDDEGGDRLTWRRLPVLRIR